MSIICDEGLSHRFENIILESIAKISKENGKSFYDVLEDFSNKADIICDGIVESYILRLEENAEDHIDYTRNLTLNFELNLQDVWGIPLNRFELLIVMCREIGSGINNEFRKDDHPNKTYQLEVATRMHAHAIHLACEILQLLKGGYADGAMARWRSIHECAVISRIIAQSSEDIAEKYFHHKVIDDYKFSQSYSEHSERLEFQKIEESHLLILKERHDKLIKKYGEKYANDNGWANDLFSKKKVSFYDLESYADLGYFRPFYKFASIRVHLGSKSIDYKLSLSTSEKFNEKEVLLSGPSNEGLVDPMQCAALSLIYITVSLMSLMESVDHIIYEKVLFSWNSKLQNELIEANEKLENRGVGN